ncbi:hypothetical protein CDL12_28303 [Handroanthus impetiginosus]|uniref:Uncharacterized protein n=1 Tax=Handroanthus impetiginosus TaxID=429701 RepID=A0A2G9G1L0_9LAMI|nr:hypothetical protein CDL12_28303 [Handroanthus impetiginosus]
MASSNFHLVLSLIMAITLSNIHGSSAARSLLQTSQPTIPPLPKATLPPLPAMPNLPTATLPPLPTNPTLPKPTLPPMPAMPKVALPPLPTNPLPTMPSIPTIPTNMPSFPFLSPPPSN